MHLRATTIVFSIFLLAVLTASTNGQQSNVTPENSTKPKSLSEMPKTSLETEISSASGEHFRLSEYSGNVLVLHLWATWCAPCRSEAPIFVKLDEQFRDRGVRIVELTTENRDASMEYVQEWISHYGIRHRVGWAPTELALTLLQGRQAIPQTFVISRSGKILQRFIGFNLDQTPLQFEKAINDALLEGSNSPTKTESDLEK